MGYGGQAAAAWVTPVKVQYLQPVSAAVAIPSCLTCNSLSDKTVAPCRPSVAKAVASAAMCVACLLNTPPGFLEFLLCVPWRKLSELFPKCVTTSAQVAIRALFDRLVFSWAA